MIVPSVAWPDRKLQVKQVAESQEASIAWKRQRWPNRASNRSPPANHLGRPIDGCGRLQQVAEPDRAEKGKHGRGAARVPLVGGGCCCSSSNKCSPPDWPSKGSGGRFARP